MSHKIAKRDRAQDRIWERRDYWRVRRKIARLLPKERVASCHRYPVPKKGCHGQGVHICAHKETGASFFSNMMSCGLIWACISCAAKITERRKKEMIQVQEKIKETRFKTYMMTLTVPHAKHDKLRALMGRFFRALYFYFFNRKFWREYKVKIGLLQFVKSLETTNTVNGWHIHIHMLLVVDPINPETGEARERPEAAVILSHWQLACESAGLGVPNEHGVTITSHNAVSKYVSKWGLESELTKQHVKKGKNGSRSPFDLARDAALKDDGQAGELFREFYHCFKGRRQLVKSRGFDKFFGLDAEKTEKEIANEAVEDSTLEGTITWEDYKLVKFHEAEAEVLEAHEQSGMPGVWDVLDTLRELPSPYQEGMRKTREIGISRGS